MENYEQLPCLTSQLGKSPVSKEPSDISNRDKVRNFSSVFDLVSLTSGDSTGDDSDLVHYRAESIILGLGVLCVSGGLSGRVLIIRRRGTQTKSFR